MKVEKLELKHLAPYLPFGLTFKDGAERVLIADGILPLSGGMHIHRGHGNEVYDLKDVAILLRPLSDLTKEITHNGETFVPIERIKNKYMLRQKWGVSEYGFYGLQSELGDWTFIHDEDQEIHPECPVAIYTQIIEWHFDVLRLIPSNLALPKQ